MSLETPTTADVAANVLAQLEASLSQTIPLLPRAFARVLSKALAGVFILLWKYAGWIFLQMFVTTASMRETTVNGRTIRPLVEWGRLIGVGDPEPATRAELVVEVTVTTQTGVLPANSQLLRTSTGVVYLTTVAIALDAATKEVTIRASSDQSGGDGSGDIGNLEVGDVVTFASPLANISRDATVLSQSVAGADGEEPEAYRTRVVRRFQRKPQGGAYADYQGWGEEDPGVVNVYPYTSDTPGEVDVYVEATVASSGSADGIPTSGQLAAVAALIDFDEDGLATRRPANAAINVYPITRTAFDVIVLGLSVADVPAGQAAIEAAIDEYLRSRAPFIVGLSILPRRDLITRSAVAAAAEDAVTATGGTIIDVTLERAGDVVVAHTLGDGETAKLGAVTYE